MRLLFGFLIFINSLFAYSLTINTNPSKAHIQIVNITQKYRDGIALKEGSYDILIRKDGYKEKRFSLYLDKDMVLNVDLEKGVSLHKLIVNTMPLNAKVRVVNIKESYRDSMMLKTGNYEIVVEADGYVSSSEKIKLNRDSVVNIKLNPLIAKESKEILIEPDLNRSKTIESTESNKSSIATPTPQKEQIDINKSVSEVAKDERWVDIYPQNFDIWNITEVASDEFQITSKKEPKHKIFVFFPRKSQAYDIAINRILDVFNQKSLLADITLYYYNDSEEIGLKAIKRVKKERYDLILSMGSQSTDFLYKHFKGEKIPVVSVCSKDPVLLNQVKDYDSGSGNNFAFTSLNIPIKIQLDYLKKLIKNLQNIVIMYSRDNKSAITTQAMPLKELALASGMNVIEVVLEDNTKAKEELSLKVAKATQDILKIDSDVSKSIFWITGSTSVFKEISTINANTKNIPVVSIVPDIVTNTSDSAVVSIGVSFGSNAHLAGLYVINILEQNMEPKDLKVGVVFPPDISINFLKSKEIGMKIPFELFEIATIVYGLNGEKL